jgi:hypothetical protein
MWASSIPNRPRMMFSSPTHSREDLAWRGARLADIRLLQRLRPPCQIDRRTPDEVYFDPTPVLAARILLTPPGCYEPEERKAAFLGMNLTKAAMWEPARAEA